MGNCLKSPTSDDISLLSGSERDSSPSDQMIEAHPVPRLEVRWSFAPLGLLQGMASFLTREDGRGAVWGPCKLCVGTVILIVLELLRKFIG